MIVSWEGLVMTVLTAAKAMIRRSEEMETIACLVAATTTF